MTALCKGLVGPVVVGIALIADGIFDRGIVKHINVKMFIGLTIAIVLYLFPFILSLFLGSDQSGLSKVYQENFVRYFHPFDHKTPFYLYFIYLPIYMAPWSIFLLPSCWNVKTHWKSYTFHEKWLVTTLVLLFIFFSASGSRRPYYILPVIPFAMLFIANWILSQPKTQILTMHLVKISWWVLVFIFLIVLPGFYMLGGRAGLQKFF